MKLKLTNAVIHFIFESTVSNNSFNYSKDLCTDIFNTFGLKISASSIRTYRHALGFRFRTLHKAQILTHDKISERLACCLQNANENFDNYQFVDETKLDINYKLRHHLRLPTFHPNCIIQNYKQRLKMNVWGCISRKRVNSAPMVVNLLNYLQKSS